MSKKKKTSPQNEHREIKNQIWGVVYISIALLILVSLMSKISGGTVNVLGPYLGTRMAYGLEYIFGPVTVFVIPVILAYIGKTIFSKGDIDGRTLAITLLFIFESSILAAIPNLDVVANPDFHATGNALGHITALFLIYPIFGSAKFGPYFILLVSMLITVVWFFKLDLSKFTALFKNSDSNFSEKIKLFFSSLKLKLKNSNSSYDDFDIDDNRIDILSDPTGGVIADEDPELVTELAPTPTDEQPFAPQIVTYNEEESEVNIESDIDEVEILIPKPTIPDPTINPFENSDEGDIADASVLAPKLIKGDEVDEHSHRDLIEEPEEPSKPYELPSVDIIPDPPAKSRDIDNIWIEEKGRSLIRTLDEFKVKGCKLVAVSPGPVVTRFEIELAPGIQVKKILNLQDDLALKVGGKAIRIQAPIPGKAAVGIEIPNDNRDTVYFKDVLLSPAFKNSKAALPVIIGKSISGAPLVEDISKMPHLLIAGQTGAGKSVGINSFIATLLFSKKPDELRMIMIDPKKVEMACYEGIPHLMSPVVTEPEKAVAALQWAVREMEFRYRLLAKVGAKNIGSFNDKVESGKLQKFIDNETVDESDAHKLPFIVVIIDELADLMMTAAKEVEGLVQRLAQLARAVGIHLIVATQRPSVDIITGPIKANLTSRISFRTIQSQDSRTILGSVGSEKLLGMGDMLYLKNGAPAIERYHGTFISEEDVENLVEAIKSQGVSVGKVKFEAASEAKASAASGAPSGVIDDRDELFEEATRMIVGSGIGSTSMIQRRLKVGYARAGRIMDQLCEAGIVGEPQGSKPREILVGADVLEDMFE
jgi:DNA segregation ATPase FtsK/SpoIIIE-like protein